MQKIILENQMKLFFIYPNKYLLIDSYQVLNINIYTFFDSSNNIISYKQAPSTTNVKIKEVVKVPENATTLIVSVNTGYAPYIVVYEDTKAEIRNNTNSIGNNIETLNNLFTYTGYDYKNDKFYQFSICDWNNQCAELIDYLLKIKINDYLISKTYLNNIDFYL